MSIQFPDSPTQGDSFTASNGVIYTYNNGGWMANSVSGLDDTYVNRTGDTMTGDLTVPNLISEGDVQTTSLNGGQLAGFRNLIQNGDFRIWQRGTSIASPSSGATVFVYGADRWLFGGDTNQSVTMQRNVGAPAGFATCGLTTVPADRPFTCRQRIEQLNSQAMETEDYTFSVYLRSDAAVTGILRWSAPTAADNFSALADLGQTVISIPGDNLWHRYSTLVPADSTFGNGAEVRFVVPTGNACTLRYTGIQMEPGPVATPFEHRPIGTELALCQRYYIKITGRTYCQPANSLDSSRLWTNAGMQPMRAVPTLGYGSATNFSTGPALGASSTKEAVYVSGVPNQSDGNTHIVDLSLDAEL